MTTTIILYFLYSICFIRKCRLRIFISNNICHLYCIYRPLQLKDLMNRSHITMNLHNHVMMTSSLMRSQYHKDYKEVYHHCLVIMDCVH